MLGASRFRRTRVASALLGLPRGDRDERELRERALSTLRQVDCEQFAERMPPTLPYPVQKRVALARALAGEPRLLLLDEPAGGLGGEDVRELGERIGALRGSMATMLVEHRMDLVMSVCDRVVVLDFGRVIAHGAQTRSATTSGCSRRTWSRDTAEGAISDGEQGAPAPGGERR